MDNFGSIEEETSNVHKTHFCYLSVPANTELRGLEQLLLERKLQSVVSADLLSTNLTFLKGVISTISSSDLFIAVLSSRESNDSVYIELGIAIAKESRILIIAPPDISLMVNIAELPNIRVDITNREAIGFMLDQVLMTPRRKIRPQLPVSSIQKGQAIGNFAGELEGNLANLGEEAREDEIIQLLIQALAKSGYSAVANNPLVGSGRSARRADLLVWSDEFGPWIGNPLMIEVKSFSRKRLDWDGVLQQVLAYLQVSQTRSALILYVGTHAKPNNLLSLFPPNIFILSIHQLFAGMRTKSFADIMIDLRNRRFHGIDEI